MTIEDGIELRNARIKKRWSQMMLAEELGISRQYVTKMENGRKPLNDKALAFIEEIVSSCDPCLGIGDENSAKKGAKTGLKTNNLQEQDCPEIVQFEEVTDFSDFDDEEEISRWEKWWFKEKHLLCQRCTKACKQSVYVKILQCPQFEEIKCQPRRKKQK